MPSTWTPLLLNCCRDRSKCMGRSYCFLDTTLEHRSGEWKESISCRVQSRRSASDSRSETPSEFVVPSLWRTCPNLIGPFIHPTAPQTRSVARRAMPQSHVAPHHLVCSRAQATRIICQCRPFNEEIRGRRHLSGATARLCMKLLRDRAGASSLVRLCRPVTATTPARAACSAAGCLLFWRGF